MKKILKDKDFLILKELIEDGRKSASSISKNLDLGREIVNYRIKRLIKENLIVKFVPKINENNLKYSEYILFLKLNLDDYISKEKFIKERIGDKYLMWFIKNNSGWDVLVRIFVHTFEDFKKKLNEILLNFNDYLANYYTIVCSEDIKNQDKKVILEKLFSHSGDDVKSIKNVAPSRFNLDEKDLKIVELLQQDARIKYKDIGEKLSLSSDSVKYRIDKLIKNNILLGFYPIINFNKLGYKQYAIILKVNNLNFDLENKFTKYVLKNNFITRAVKSLNTSEYFLTVIFEKDEEYDTLIKEINEIFNNNIETIERFVLE